MSNDNPIIRPNESLAEKMAVQALARAAREAAEQAQKAQQEAETRANELYGPVIDRLYAGILAAFRAMNESAPDVWAVAAAVQVQTPMGTVNLVIEPEKTVEGSNEGDNDATNH